MFTGTDTMTEESGQGLIVRESKVEPVAPNSNGHKALTPVEPAMETAEDAAYSPELPGHSRLVAAV